MAKGQAVMHHPYKQHLSKCFLCGPNNVIMECQLRSRVLYWILPGALTQGPKGHNFDMNETVSKITINPASILFFMSHFGENTKRRIVGICSKQGVETKKLQVLVRRTEWNFPS
jgi:hypothetical protein